MPTRATIPAIKFGPPMIPAVPRLALWVAVIPAVIQAAAILIQVVIRAVVGILIREGEFLKFRGAISPIIPSCSR